MIAVVDYGMGNLKSVANAACAVGARVTVTSDPSCVAKADKIIFPGVGHFGRAVKELRQRKLFGVLADTIREGTPFLGICLGMQILFEKSEEAPGAKGLGVLKGTVKRFRDKNLIVPHMGWNRVAYTPCAAQAPVCAGIEDKSYFYFVHSFYCEPKEKDSILGTTGYGVNFASIIGQGNVWAVQFHAEKSQSLGLRLLQNFLKLC